jgi:hypothetical protein
MALDSDVSERRHKMTADDNDTGDAPVVVRKYRDMPEAFAARATLEAAGIDCYLYDETVIRLDWLWSNAMSNLKLVVRSEEADEAKRILDEETPEKFDVEGIGEYEQPRCPSCGSLDVSWKELRKRIAFAGLLFIGFPILIKEKAWHCHSCNHRWGGKENCSSQE